MKNFNIKKIVILLSIFHFLFSEVALAQQASSTNFISNNSALVIVGGESSSTNFVNIGVGGLIAPGETSSTNFVNQGGILYFGNLSTGSSGGGGSGGGSNGSSGSSISGAGGGGGAVTIISSTNNAGSSTSSFYQQAASVGLVGKIANLFALRAPLLGKVANLFKLQLSTNNLGLGELPLAIKNGWGLLGRKGLQDLVFQSLPSEFSMFKEKFPQLRTILSQIGINRLPQLISLQNVNLYLPGFLEMRRQVPTEIVFARSPDNKIDYNINLKLDENGRPQQTISVLTGQVISLAVKPKAPARSVRGLVIFKNSVADNSFYTGLLLTIFKPLKFDGRPSLLASLTQDSSPERKKLLTLNQFEYKDPDGDGVYTATIKMPATAGEYDIKTIIEYADPYLAAKEVDLITVIDPEGYVYTNTGYGRARIKGAEVTLFYLSLEKTNQKSNYSAYKIWSAREFRQENPQTTDNSGRYAFLVPQGWYYLQVEATGLRNYRSKPFEVSFGRGIHMDVEMKKEFLLQKIFKPLL